MKRIISCSDGTWNKPGASDRGKKITVTDKGKKVHVTDDDNHDDTNVVKMYNSICSLDKRLPGSQVAQVKIYDEGVGTGYGWRDKLLGGMSGAGLDKNIKDVYTFFVLNYQPGDQVFLFGFSRGAYTARSVGGFIRNCGILKPENIGLVNKAYELYRDRNVYTHPESDLMKSFRAAYCFEDITPIHFIGVWDTVGSLGIPVPWLKSYNMQRYRFHDETLSSHVRHAYHALAIDEKRALFKPTLWEKSESVKNNPAVQQKMEQRWFAGVHSNVGGGYPDCGLSNLTLDWLIHKAQDAELCFNDPPLVKNRDTDRGVIVNSYTPMYWFWRPSWREIDLTNEDTNQAIDESVKERLTTDKRYQPKNLRGVTY
jgi:uncharacterized protein (DUF2235 family)